MKVKNVIPTLKKGQAYEINGSDFSMGIFERLEKEQWMAKKYTTDDDYVMKIFGDMKVKSLKFEQIKTKKPYRLLIIEVVE